MYGILGIVCCVPRAVNIKRSKTTNRDTPSGWEELWRRMETLERAERATNQRDRVGVRHHFAAAAIDAARFAREGLQDERDRYLAK